MPTVCPLPALVVVGLLAPPAAPPDLKRDQAGEAARAVLRKQCLECHGGKKTRGGLSVLDHTSLQKRVVAGKPDDSELLQMVECGHMPPGSRPKLKPEERAALRAWVAAGVPPFPPDSGEPYVLRKVLEDVRALGREGKDPKSFRYVSFNHLLPGGATEAEVREGRAALTEALKKLSRKADPEPIDPTGTLFRIDLRQLGWDRPVPLKGDRQLNPFDLVLLEYPYATLPAGSEAFAALENEYLKPAALVRPIVYVRGDWFLNTALKPPLYEDLFDLPRTPDGLKKKLDLRVRDGDPRSLLPLDGLTFPQYQPNDSPVQVRLETFKVEGTKEIAAKEFFPGDKLVIRVTNRGPKPVYVELIGLDPDGGRAYLLHQEMTDRPVLVGPGTSYRFPAANKDPLTIMASYGHDLFTVFASDRPFPPGVRLAHLDKGTNVAERVVHPFYEPWRGGKRFDPAGMVKITKAIETKPKPGKDDRK
jgi:mono/diheme cytochrome c family protein